MLVVQSNEEITEEYDSNDDNFWFSDNPATQAPGAFSIQSA
jgi:hypothetical protein